jgi:DNA primase large subunit
MKAIIDRIENDKLAVVAFEGMGKLMVPVREFGFKIYEGMHLTVEFSPDPKSEKRLREEIKELQDELLKLKNEKCNKMSR